MAQVELINQIKNDILSGKDVTLNKCDLKLEDYLYKDDNNESFLEFLLKNNYKLDYYEEKKLFTSLDAAYLYYKYDKGLYSFKLTEEELFKEVEPNKTFISLLIEKNAVTSNFVGTIDNHIEIVDLIYNSKSRVHVTEFSDKIKNQLLKEDENGKFLLENYSDDETFVSGVIKSVNEPKIIYNFCEKTNQKHLLKYASSEALMYDIEPGKTFLTFLLENEIEPVKLLDIPSQDNFIKFLVAQNQYNYLVNARETQMLTKIDGDKTLCDILAEKNLLKELTYYAFTIDTFKVLFKYGLINIYKGNINERILKTKMSDISGNENEQGILLDFLSDDVTFDCTDQEIIQMLFNSKRFKLLAKNIKEKDVLISVDGKCILDTLLDNNIELEFIKYGINDLNVAKKIFDKNRLDLMKHFSLQILLEKIDNKTYLEHLLEGVKSDKIKLNLTKIRFGLSPMSEIAKFYIILAENNMINYVNKLDKQGLLTEKNGVKLIDELLNQNPELTFKSIIPENVKSNVEIAIYLKKYGINQEKYDVSSEKNLVDEYLIERGTHYGVGPLPKEGEELLSYLEELFRNDGISDMKIVNSLITGYRHSLVNNYNYFINEVRNLIQIKEEYPDKFLYHQSKNGGAYFRLNDGAIYCDYATVETLIHETGHALHHYMANDMVPENYHDVIRRVRENPETLEKVKKYADFYNQIKDQVKAQLEIESEEYFKKHYKTDEEIQEILNKSLEEKKKGFEGLGISDEILDTILKEAFTVEEYRKHQKRIYIQEHFDAITGNEYTAFYALCDILDAIYEGKIYSEALALENGETVKRIAGHGIPYYSNTDHGFDEMVANISLISKSKDSQKVLAILKDIAGEELYNMVTEFYEKNIVYGSVQRGKSR